MKTFNLEQIHQFIASCYKDAGNAESRAQANLLGGATEEWLVSAKFWKDMAKQAEKWLAEELDREEH